MNPLEEDVALLLGGGDPENKPTLEDMQTKALAFEDILPILWALSQYKEPGSYSDFCEALKVKSPHEIFFQFKSEFRFLTEKEMEKYHQQNSEEQ